MTSQELIRAGKNKVRYDSNLMTAYIGAFKSVFGHEPDCAGCTLNNDWTKFENAVNNGVQPQKIETMSETSFKLRDTSKIYSYDYTHENGRKLRARAFGYNMTEEFAQEYLTEGTAEEIEGRKAEFKILPIAIREAAAQDNTDSENLKDGDDDSKTGDTGPTGDKDLGNTDIEKTEKELQPVQDKPIDPTIEVVLLKEQESDSVTKAEEQTPDLSSENLTEETAEQTPEKENPVDEKQQKPVSTKRNTPKK